MKLEKSNPFFFLLVVASTAFIVTVLAHTVVPWENQPIWLQQQGWKIVLVEVGILIVLGLLSMGLDRWQTLREKDGNLNEDPQP